MAGKSPQGQLTEMNPAKVQAIIHSLRELYDMGKPETNEELKQRIDMFFQFCEESSIRPGVQALCTALHISRTTLFRWNNGEDCDKERQEIIGMAKSFIDGFLEQVTMSGQVSPPVGIFLLKNWCSYKDTISIEESTKQMPEIKMQSRTPEEIAASYGHFTNDNCLADMVLPELPED